MIKANEIRIGNWFDFYGRPMQVRPITINDIFYGKIYEPIPLTEEWLIKFGFEKLDSSSCIVYHIGHNEITHDWLFDLTWLKKPELINSPNAPFYKNGRHTIYYVHQLQNLYFALTGEELTIKEVTNEIH